MYNLIVDKIEWHKCIRGKNWIIGNSSTVFDHPDVVQRPYSSMYGKAYWSVYRWTMMSFFVDRLAVITRAMGFGFCQRTEHLLIYIWVVPRSYITVLYFTSEKDRYLLAVCVGTVITDSESSVMLPFWRLFTSNIVVIWVFRSTMRWPWFDHNYS